VKIKESADCWLLFFDGFSRVDTQVCLPTWKNRLSGILFFLYRTSIVRLPFCFSKSGEFLFKLTLGDGPGEISDLQWQVNQ